MNKSNWLFIIWLLFPFTFFCICSIVSCTLSFQNISTHGVATDLVDENMRADADIQTDLPPLPLE